MADKEFIGSVKISTTKYGEMTRLSFNETDIAKLLEKAKGNNGWVNLNLKVGMSGKPYLEVDNWKPAAKNGGSPAGYRNDSDGDDSLPF